MRTNISQSHKISIVFPEDENNPCRPWRERYPVESGAGSHATCSSNGDPHPVTFDGRRFDYYKIGDWALVESDRRDFHVCCLQYSSNSYKFHHKSLGLESSFRAYTPQHPLRDCL